MLQPDFTPVNNENAKITILWNRGMERDFNKDGMLDHFCKEEMQRYRRYNDPFNKKQILCDCIIKVILTVGPYTSSGTAYNLITKLKRERDNIVLEWHGVSWPELTEEDWRVAQAYRAPNDGKVVSSGEEVFNVVGGIILGILAVSLFLGLVGFLFGAA